MDINFPKNEEKILKFWRDNNIFEKSLKKGKGARNFIFYEGPPTANGRPGIHHVESRVFKDIVCRYKTMRGFRVERKAGWDTHGLPVELEVEKALGLKSKKEIEDYGIAKFNKKCQESVWKYKMEWEKLTERIGFWLDLKNPYITYQTDYIESVWWILKQIYQKGLLYRDYKVVPYCPRCGTSLSSHEVALGYKKIKEPAIYFKLKVQNPEFQNTYLLVWTTTPWTLPGNVAVAAKPGAKYVRVKSGNEYLILAEKRLGLLAAGYEIIEKLDFKKDLQKIIYEPLFDWDKSEYFNRKVVGGEFVSSDEGTGLVHIAPAFGVEDMEVGKWNKLPVLLPVDEQGKFKLDVKFWAGMFVKEADPLIIENLKSRNLLFKSELYEHDYPFCWRCSSVLLYYAKQSWFINMQKVKAALIANNQKINWIPGHLKDGRFGEWLEDVKDWAFSRERYWGTPLPFWQCHACGHKEFIGSLSDLISQKFSSNNYYILRHGHSLRQIKKLTSCWPEKKPYPLTEKGKKEVLRSAEELNKEKIDLIFSSDLLRTKETAKIIAEKTGAKVFFDKRLREFNAGVFNGGDPKLVWEFLEKSDDFLTTKLKKGESLNDIAARTFGFMESTDKKYKDKNILIVSHELPLTVLDGILQGKSLKKVLAERKLGGAKGLGTGRWKKISFADLPFNEDAELDLHRPYIDRIKFFCPECRGLMKRVSEVIDCWFDSGAMPFAQHHYPFENKEMIDKNIQFPADYISEAVDQTRGWFYTLLAISSLLGSGPAYKNVISLGHVLDEKGEKMSKSKGNIVDPWQIIEKYGIDAARWYFFTINQPGEPKLFSEKEIEAALKKFILTFWNSFLFFETYKYDVKKSGRPKGIQSANVLDKWIISRLNGLVRGVTDALESYDVVSGARLIENFVVNDLSQWYIRRSRRRFHANQELTEGRSPDDFKNASETLGSVLLETSKLSAPFIPFLSEEIFRDLGKNISVHLADWPKPDKDLIDKKLEKEMEKARTIVSLALAERAKAGIKVRQPLSKLKIKNAKDKISFPLLELIREEVNVKEAVFDDKIKGDIELDVKITKELEIEGLIREVVRNIQEMRKQAGLKPKDKISVYFSATPALNEIFAEKKAFIIREARVQDLVFVRKSGEKFNAKREAVVAGRKFYLAIKVV